MANDDYDIESSNSSIIYHTRHLMSYHIMSSHNLGISTLMMHFNNSPVSLLVDTAIFPDAVVVGVVVILGVPPTTKK